MASADTIGKASLPIVHTFFAVQQVSYSEHKNTYRSVWYDKRTLLQEDLLRNHDRFGENVICDTHEWYHRIVTHLKARSLALHCTGYYLHRF